MEPTPSPELPYFVESLDPGQPALQEKYRRGYVRRDVDHPAVKEAQEAKARLADYRENNRALNSLKQELEAKLKAYEGIDPVEHRALTERLKELEAEAAAANQSQARAAEAEAALQSERAAHAETRIRGEVSAAFLAIGGRPEAADYIVSKASEEFSVDAAGRVTSREYSKTDPSGKLTVAEWLTGQLTSSAFAFQPSRGGGASPSSGRPGGAVRTISRDPLEFGRHVEEIAQGTVIVQ